MSITLTGKDYSRPIRYLGMYPDNTPMVKLEDLDEIVRKSDTMTIRHTSLHEFITAMFLVDAIRANGGHIYNLILPYVPGARQDRSNPTGDVLITLASVARMLNERMFNQVVVLDPHSPVAGQLIHRMVVYPQRLVARGLPKYLYDGVIATDKGGVVRAEEVAATLGVPTFYGIKTRDVSTGKLSGFSLGAISQGHYLVVDDICDGGGTFLGLAAEIIKQGSTAGLFVSHGIFSKGAGVLTPFYSNIYTTDSLIGSDDGGRVSVIPVVKDMESYNG